MSSERIADYLRDIVTNIDRINAHIKDIDDAEDYAGNDMAVDAVERCLQRVTEAAIRLQKIDNDILPQQDFDEMRGFGNRLRHDYTDINSQIVWDTVQFDLPRLRDDCLEALKALEG